MRSEAPYADVSRPRFSLEFFPPHSDALLATLKRRIRAIQDLPIDWVSVTYGAGGSTRERTHELVRAIRHTTRFDPIAHLTAVCHTNREIEDILARYARDDIATILALGGDPPRDASLPCPSGDYTYAIDLVRHIVEFNRRGGHLRRGGFHIGTAGFPEGRPAASGRRRELRYLRDKIDLGVTYICTQLFFDNRDFYAYRQHCLRAGIDVPIVAGLMPITSQRVYQRIPQLALGARYPAALRRAVMRCRNDTQICRVGIDWTLEQCCDLLRHGVAGIHLYCLNNTDNVRRLFAGLMMHGAIEFSER